MATIYEVERNGEVIKVKKCLHCLSYKSIEKSFRKRRDGYLNSVCHTCQNKYNRERRRKERGKV